MRAYSLALRQRVLDAYRAGEGTQPEPAQRFSLSFVEKLPVVTPVINCERTSGM